MSYHAARTNGGQFSTEARGGREYIEASREEIDLDALERGRELEARRKLDKGKKTGESLDASLQFRQPIIIPKPKSH